MRDHARKRCRRVLGVLLVMGVVITSDPAIPHKRSAETGPPLQAILEAETTARLLAVLLDSGRAVINENQERFDDLEKAAAFTPLLFEQQLIEIFRSRSGIDLRDLDSIRLPEDTKRFLRVMVASSKQVVEDLQPEISYKGSGFRGLIPAVFGARVANRFSTVTGREAEANSPGHPQPFKCPRSL